MGGYHCKVLRHPKRSQLPLVRINVNPTCHQRMVSTNWWRWKRRRFDGCIAM